MTRNICGMISRSLAKADLRFRTPLLLDFDTQGSLRSPMGWVESRLQRSLGIFKLTQTKDFSFPSLITNHSSLTTNHSSLTTNHFLIYPLQQYPLPQKPEPDEGDDSFQDAADADGPPNAFDAES
ncbi:hypothetical protein M2480_000313 [Parabacteroides sp. PFB2-12]|nr:hypothetical protein [Parabacteroides sp. PM6-13]MDH6389353.1 hypothetical protein [Parabacteroides sp. PFB2-12]